MAKESKKLAESSEEIIENMANISLNAENIREPINLVLSTREEEKTAVQKVSEQLA